jgi:hypothetical protein
LSARKVPPVCWTDRYPEAFFLFLLCFDLGDFV